MAVYHNVYISEERCSDRKWHYGIKEKCMQCCGLIKEKHHCFICECREHEQLKNNENRKSLI